MINLTMPFGKILPQNFFARDVTEVALTLLGKVLYCENERGFFAGEIVETEAYLGEIDLASHASKGRTSRTEIMFGPPGNAYVYMIYGMYFCLNAVCEKNGHAAAVLIRALMPLILQNENLNETTTQWQGKKLNKILNGPGKLCREFGIDLRYQGVKFSKNSGLYIRDHRDIPASKIVTTSRIGVDYAKEWKDKPLRFYINNSNFVSKK